MAGGYVEHADSGHAGLFQVLGLLLESSISEIALPRRAIATLYATHMVEPAMGSSLAGTSRRDSSQPPWPVVQHCAGSICLSWTVTPAAFGCPAKTSPSSRALPTGDVLSSSVSCS